MKLDDSFRDHYKSSLVDAWDKVSKVKIALYDNGESKLSLIFNAVGATKTEWFTKARLLNYPWKDLRTKTPATFNMVMTGTNGRRYWNIFDVLGNCRDRILWLSVAPFVGCIHELTEPVPVFMYSDRKTSIKAQPDVLIDSYLDNGAEKSLSSYILKSPGVTAWDCLDLCRGLDYKYAGVNNKHTECYCGDSGYDSGGTATYTQRVESDVTLMMNTVQPWELHQTISDTNFPKKTDSFEHDGNYYIIVQSTENSEARPLHTHVYKYRKSTELFEPHQLIDSPYKFNTFTLVQAYRQWYLIFPPIKDISTNSMSGLKAAFYRLEGNYFIKHFEKDTCSSYGWGSFTVNNDVYIIEGNSYGEPCDSPNSNGNLKIYKWI
ncbi:uncharacterized protein [Antedon mediterranea]|uniref:uncharacterized protein n=1 Tax=Antedon mediterranea TaxID=105859 RepID=UPI003AF5CC2D